MNDQKNKTRPLVLLTGATGYIGGRLVPYLLAQGFRCRLLVRGGSARLEERPWVDQVEIVDGDVLKPETLEPALSGVTTAYYLIHSMKAGDAFRKRDQQAAKNFAKAAEKGGVRRIIYLGGLGKGDDLSTHLKSRQETGKVLRDGTVQTIEFRAAIIIGSGSVSFELIRYLMERLPIVVAPAWISTRIQPIAVQDILRYLVAAAFVSESVDRLGESARIIEVGGDDVLSYQEMLAGYADARQLERRFISLPFLTPTLVSYGAHLITPVSANIAQPLIKGLKNEVIVTDKSADRFFPDIIPINYAEALDEALENLESGDIETIWNDSYSSSIGDREPTLFVEEQGMLIERRERLVDAEPDAVFRAFAGLGGPNGWPLQWLWEIRGWMDRLIGGVGLRRGRRHPNQLRTGDALDFWRVEEIEQDRLLRLRAEMIVPGDAWLQFEVQTDDTKRDKSQLTQIAYFTPRGLLGYLYWYAVFPLHGFVFPDMLNHVAEKAEQFESRRQHYA